MCLINKAKEVLNETQVSPKEVMNTLPLAKLSESFALEDLSRPTFTTTKII